jgi:hypothetical protein
MRAHSGIAHPAQEEVGGGAMLFGEEDAGEVPGRLGYSSEFIDPADDFIAKGRVSTSDESGLFFGHANPRPIHEIRSASTYTDRTERQMAAYIALARSRRASDDARRPLPARGAGSGETIRTSL